MLVHSGCSSDWPKNRCICVTFKTLHLSWFSFRILVNEHKTQGVCALLGNFAFILLPILSLSVKASGFF